MITTHLYVGFEYETYNNSFVTVAPFLVAPSGTYNGRNQYNVYYTIEGIEYIFRIQWEIETWRTYITTTGTNIPVELLAELSDPYTQEQYPGVTTPVNWTLQLYEGFINIVEFTTYIEEEINPGCTYWESYVDTNLPLPWQDKVWYLDSNETGLFPGQTINEVTFENGTPEFEGTEVYHIAALLYTNSSETAYSTTQSTIYSVFVGIIVMDSNNDYVLPIATGETENNGGICFAYAVPPTEEEIQIECYKKAVWSKQCQYSTAVDKYRQAMIFGSVCCNMLENLKQQRRILNILNCYDTRDLYNNTTLYNTLTYTQIQQLLTL
jgi:hypothetical protein